MQVTFFGEVKLAINKRNGISRRNLGNKFSISFIYTYICAYIFKIWQVSHPDFDSARSKLFIQVGDLNFKIFQKIQGKSNNVSYKRILEIVDDESAR